MAYLYHVVPPDMRGTVLFPLNTLRDVYPDLYGVKAQKYRGREQVMTFRVPTLNCIWNDVLFLLAVGPQELRRAFQWVGLTRQLRFYRVDPAQLSVANTTVMTRMNTNDPRAFEPFDPNDLERHAVIPEATYAHWKRASSGTERLFWWLHIPHIMYKGAIDVSNAPIVEA